MWTIFIFTISFFKQNSTKVFLLKLYFALVFYSNFCNMFRVCFRTLWKHINQKIEKKQKRKRESNKKSEEPTEAQPIVFHLVHDLTYRTMFSSHVVHGSLLSSLPQLFQCSFLFDSNMKDAHILVEVSFSKLIFHFHVGISLTNLVHRMPSTGVHIPISLLRPL
jgi:hypothetical protein